MWLALALALITVARVRAQIGTSNVPPQVSLDWPANLGYLTELTYLRLRADVTPGSHPVIFVQFFADTSLIATVTNPPYATMWGLVPKPGPRYGCTGTWTLRAVATDTAGLGAKSASVPLLYNCNPGPMPIVQIRSPHSGAVFAAPATFSISADLLGSPDGYAAPVEFFAGTSSLGVVAQADPKFTVETPPYTLTVSNLAEGQYTLSAGYLGLNSNWCWCGSVSIRVTKLGIESPVVTSDGLVEFGLVTSFPGSATVIEASPDLANWAPIATNLPSDSTFTFVDPSPATNGARFYRAIVPSQ